jgi:hypothetical protein
VLLLRYGEVVPLENETVANVLPPPFNVRRPVPAVPVKERVEVPAFKVADEAILHKAKPPDSVHVPLPILRVRVPEPVLI